MANDNRQEIAESLRRLAAAHANNIASFEETITILCRALDLDQITFDVQAPLSIVPPNPPTIAIPTIDSSLLSIVYRDRRCFLGNTLPLRFFERLAKRPNQYVSYHDLLADVWRGRRSNEAVRSVAQVLKQKLKKARMGDVAKAIDGSNRGYFGLILDRMP